MSLILARIIVGFGLAAAPFAAFAILSRQMHAALVILVPLLGAVPAILGALLIFWPVELWLSGMGLAWAKDIVIPAIGACLVFVTLFLSSLAQSHSLTRAFKRVFVAKPLSTFGVYIGAGFLFGVCWRLTEWLAKFMGLANG